MLSRKDIHKNTSLFDYDINSLLEDFLDIGVVDAALCVSFRKLSELPKTITNADVAENLSELIQTTRGSYSFDLNSSYILGIFGDLKFAQYSNNYLFDDLMNIKSFVDSKHKSFNKNLEKLRFIDDNLKYKYVQKAVKKGKPTPYNDDSFGTNILYFIAGELKGVVGNKLDMPNCILDNLNNPDSYMKKIIIILSFDVNMFEIYHSVPLTMYQKGSLDLENELVYCCRLDEIEPTNIFNHVVDYFNNL